MQIEPQAGGKIEFSGDPHMPPTIGKILVFEPPRRLAYTWGADELISSWRRSVTRAAG
ncbi:MAG: hypothetical protein JO287_10630 [Pseudonocardiales bacterium]|nr:hypothetical protein [Pseudonocardiales bacterium]